MTEVAQCSCSKDGWNWRIVSIIYWAEGNRWHKGAVRQDKGWGGRQHLHHWVAIYRNPDPQWCQPRKQTKNKNNLPPCVPTLTNTCTFLSRYLLTRGSAAAYNTPVHTLGFKTRALAVILITTVLVDHATCVSGSMSSDETGHSIPLF